MCSVATWLITFWKQSQCAHWLHCDQIDGHIVKELRGFFQNVIASHIVINIVKETHVFFHNVIAGHLGEYFLKEINMYPPVTFWFNWLKNHNVFTM